MGAPSPDPPRRSRSPVFRPRFTLMLLWLVFFYVLFALLLGLPELIEGARSLPPGGDTASPEDLARAEEIMRGVLAGRLHLCLGAAVVVVGLLSWYGALPGVRQPEPGPPSRSAR